jgi:SAM-dependent methyltransferase
MSDRDKAISDYTDAYRAHYGFEATMVAARRRLIIELLAKLRPRTVVEIGCGSELLCRTALPATPEIKRWVIVEPSPDFAGQARTQTAALPEVDIVEAFLENAASEARDLCGAQPELVICSALLHEVPDPAGLLDAARAVLGDGTGLLHVNVPNALSLHRRLARNMGLIERESELTERNRLLSQRAVYDVALLESTVAAAGFRPIETGGFFVKPVTHGQMESLEFLTSQIVDGLWQLGRELPELAAEIFVNAVVTR